MANQPAVTFGSDVLKIEEGSVIVLTIPPPMMEDMQQYDMVRELRQFARQHNCLFVAIEEGVKLEQISAEQLASIGLKKIEEQ